MARIPQHPRGHLVPPTTSPSVGSSSLMSSSDSPSTVLSSKDANSRLLSALASEGLKMPEFSAFLQCHALQPVGRQGPASPIVPEATTLALLNQDPIIRQAVWRCKMMMVLVGKAMRKEMRKGHAVPSPYPLITDPRTMHLHATSEMRVGVWQRELCSKANQGFTTRTLDGQRAAAEEKFKTRRAAKAARSAASAATVTPYVLQHTLGAVTALKKVLGNPPAALIKRSASKEQSASAVAVSSKKHKGESALEAIVLGAQSPTAAAAQEPSSQPSSKRQAVSLKGPELSGEKASPQETAGVTQAKQPQSRIVAAAAAPAALPAAAPSRALALQAQGDSVLVLKLPSGVEQAPSLWKRKTSGSDLPSGPQLASESLAPATGSESKPPSEAGSSSSSIEFSEDENGSESSSTDEDAPENGGPFQRSPVEDHWDKESDQPIYYKYKTPIDGPPYMRTGFEYSCANPRYSAPLAAQSSENRTGQQEVVGQHGEDSQDPQPTGGVSAGASNSTELRAMVQKLDLAAALKKAEQQAALQAMRDKIEFEKQMLELQKPMRYIPSPEKEVEAPKDFAAVSPGALSMGAQSQDSFAVSTASSNSSFYKSGSKQFKQAATSTAGSAGAEIYIPGKAVLPWNTKWEDLTADQKEGAVLMEWTGNKGHMGWDNSGKAFVNGEGRMPIAFAGEVLSECKLQHRKGAKKLSISPSSFQCLSVNGPIAYFDRFWKYLLKEHRDHARTLGVNKPGEDDTKQWDQLDSAGEDPAWRMFLKFRTRFDKLPPKDREAALGLHWSKESWTKLRKGIAKNVKAHELEESQAQLAAEADAEVDEAESDSGNFEDCSDDASISEESWNDKVAKTKAAHEAATLLQATVGKAELAQPGSESSGTSSAASSVSAPAPTAAAAAAAAATEAAAAAAAATAASSAQPSQAPAVTAAEVEETELQAMPSSNRGQLQRAPSHVESSVHSVPSTRKIEQGFYDAVAIRASMGFSISPQIKVALTLKLQNGVAPTVWQGDPMSLNSVYCVNCNHIDYLPGRVKKERMFDALTPWSLKWFLSVSPRYMNSIRSERFSIETGTGRLMSDNAANAADAAAFTRRSQMTFAIQTRALCMMKIPLTDCQGYLDKSQFGPFMEYNFWLMTLCSEYSLEAICTVDDSLMASRQAEQWDFGDATLARETLRVFGDNLKLANNLKHCLMCEAAGDKFSKPTKRMLLLGWLIDISNNSVAQWHISPNYTMRTELMRRTAGHTFVNCPNKDLARELTSVIGKPVHGAADESFCRMFNVTSCAGNCGQVSR